MFPWLSHVLVNRSIRFKLVLGFGLVLQLTLVIAATGWYALQRSIDHSEQLSLMARLGQITRNVRSQRMAWRQLDDPQSHAELEPQLAEIERHLETLHGRIREPLYQQRLAQQGDHLRALRSTLGDLDPIHGNPDEADRLHERLENLGQALLDGIDALSQAQTQKRDQDANLSKRMLIIVASLALIIGTLSAWVISAQILIPLRRSLKIAEYIAAGDLSRNIRVERGDELGQLQQALQRMSLGLRELVVGISQETTRMASAARELSDNAAQTHLSIGHQHDEIDQVATAMKQMSSSVREVALNAEATAQATSLAEQQSREGDRAVAEAITQIEHLEQEMQQCTEAMASLQQESDKIGGVLDVIKSVSLQTNLLALNATIEAARAGEAGRGFAVVADEVRCLAQHTQDSAEEIEALVAALQHDTARVAQRLDKSRNLTRSSVEASQHCGSKLEGISRSVSRIQAMNEQIAAAGEEQSVVAEQVSRSLLQVRDIAQRTAATSEKTATASAELACQGSRLQGLVGHLRA
ncbi:methyl-accepting chemotaxis protein [Pseudomonas asplenii]|uniref:Methyl-accepting chemotaxis protein n=1 Tax=Pseudomonas asplenii TaxID=53407 RepID=A0A1H1QX60_9PSED|nr:methyl-accepting chemotaxis protein [Pseudomonas asplenii]SDS27952.1 methyl-accepting chemotaxis protein [Pseudomonas asplenii]